MASADKKLTSVDTPILILVEGSTDKAFIEDHLLNTDALKPLKGLFTIHAADSYQKIGQMIENIESIRGFHQLSTLAVIADADESPAERANEIESWLNRLNGLGSAIQSQCLLTPSMEEPGALESLVLKALKPEQLACADAYISCVSVRTSLNVAQRDKLRLYAWMSEQDKEPMTNFMRVKHTGVRAIDVNHAAFAPIVEFLKKLAASCSPKS
jgi:hypothetical protein